MVFSCESSVDMKDGRRDEFEYLREAEGSDLDRVIDPVKLVKLITYFPLSLMHSYVFLSTLLASIFMFMPSNLILFDDNDDKTGVDDVMSLLLLVTVVTVLES